MAKRLRLYPDQNTEAHLAVVRAQKYRREDQPRIKRECLVAGVRYNGIWPGHPDKHSVTLDRGKGTDAIVHVEGSVAAVVERKRAEGFKKLPE